MLEGQPTNSPERPTNSAGRATNSAADCCADRAVDPRIARHFDARIRRLAAEAGGFPEMAEVSQALLSMLGSDAAELHPSLLELGSGSGALSVALLERGVARVDGVDLSAESVATARRRADAAGVGDQANFQVGDGSSAKVAAHDWVVLDRVICCFPDVDRLLTNSIGAAEQRLAFSVPHVRGWRGFINRIIVTSENATNRFRGRPCPGYLHPVRTIERRLRDAGFERLREKTVGLWYAAVWERLTP